VLILLDHKQMRPVWLVVRSDLEVPLGVLPMLVHHSRFEDIIQGIGEETHTNGSPTSCDQGDNRVE
jgi:hypothetical protein